MRHGFTTLGQKRNDTLWSDITYFTYEEVEDAYFGR
jgi:hypothetical protein